MFLKNITRLLIIFTIFVTSHIFILQAMAAPAEAPKPQEGLIKITDIEIKGNKAISTATILGMMTIKIGDEITKSALNRQGRDLFATGYFEDVLIDTDKYMDGSKVTITVIEHPILKDVVFEGNKSIPSASLKKFFEPIIGKAMSIESVNKAAGAINDEYKNRGYVLARITNIDDKEDGTLVISIVEGEIDNITVIGNTTTNAVVITRGMRNKKGGVYNQESLKKDYQDLYNLGIFDDVSIEPEPSATSPDKVSLKVTIREGRTGSFGISGGTSNLSGLFVGANISFKNFMGMNRKLSLNGQFGQLQTNYTFSYFDPWIDDNRTSFGFDASARTTNNIYVNYTEQRNLLDIIVGRPITDEIGVSLIAKTERVTILRSASTSITGLPLTSAGQPITISGTNSDQVNTLSGVIAYDTRDIKRKAHQGIYTRLGVDKAGGLFGGDANFTRYNISNTIFIPVTDTHTLIVNTQYGTINGLYGIAERFYMGGSSTLRGYPDLSFNGDNMLLGTLEYTVPFFVKNLDAAVFLDAGTTYMNGAAIPGLSTSYGFGIRFDTPIAPIRIDYAIPNDPRYPNGKIEFGLGSRF